MNTNPVYNQELQYTHTNPPSTVQEALQQLNLVEESIVRIKADLQARTERDLGTPDAYDAWKFRATRALHHKNREKNFLKHWVNETARKATKSEMRASHAQSLKDVQSRVDEFLASATPYMPVFSEENPPDSLRQARERREVLSDLKLEYAEFLHGLKDTVEQLGFPPTFHGGGRGRVGRVIQKIEKELLLLNKYIRISSEGEYDHSVPAPLRGGGPQLLAIQEEMRKIKHLLGMGSAEMTVWLFNLVSEQRTRLKLETTQNETLELIERYVQLTLQRRKAQGNPL
ncbi:MAG: hypothetical protein Q8P52_02530 [bacterium]|nr:hypothetical protein [bacterium]